MVFTHSCITRRLPIEGSTLLMAASGGALEAAWYRGAWWLWLLRPLECCFRLLAAARRCLYRCGILHNYRAPVPVVVVGNITVGGTGKTPVVIALVQALQDRGIRVGVVSRGYGGSNEEFPYQVDDNSEASHCGDEPLLIYRRTGCPVVVAPQRSTAVKALLASCAVDMIISDDGLQHYAMARDLEIACLDAVLATGNGFCLPAGPLREPPSRLRTVDYVLYRGGRDVATAVSYRPDGLVNLLSGECSALSPAVTGTEVYAVAGIGRPEQFFDSLRAAGFDVRPRPFTDHHAFCASDFHKLGDLPIIMTEKDAVKCAGFVGKQAWSLRISAQLPPTLVSKVAALVVRA